MPFTAGGVSCAPAGMAGARANRRRENRAVRSFMAISPGRVVSVDRRNRPHPKIRSVTRTSQDRGIVPPIVTKSGPNQMDFLTVWQASPERKTECLNVHLLDLRAARHNPPSVLWNAAPRRTLTQQEADRDRVDMDRID